MVRAELSILAKFFQERRALLWVCQPYDLLPGEQPHEYDLPKNEAMLRYRQEATETDAALTGLYWEAIWFEGVQSNILNSLRHRQREGSSGDRKLVLLASEADAKANVNTADFLPVFALGGVLETGSSLTLASQYDPTKRRTRDRTAWDLSCRLVEFPRRLLVVVGADQQADVTRLFDVLSEKPILDLTVIFVIPKGTTPPTVPSSPGVKWLSWEGTVAEFAQALTSIEAPKAGELPHWAVRIGKKTVILSERDVSRIRENFAILTERSLLPADNFTLEDLHAFFSHSLENWKSYTETVGLPVERSYRTASNQTLADMLLAQLTNSNTEHDMASFFHIQLPSESGSGATTLLHQAAFRAAQQGFPTLVFRPDRVSLDLDEVTAFASTFIERCLEQGITKSPVFLLVFDVEHEPLPELRKLGPTLASAGRTVVILQAVSSKEAYTDEIVGRNGRLLSKLKADATTDEVARCNDLFSSVVDRWHLDLSIPNQDAWNTFSVASKFLDGSTAEPTSKFWVALWFFLTQEMDIVTADRFRDALGTWILRRTNQITSPEMRTVLDYVAALSSFRLPSPLWSVLRPATGGSFNSDLAPILKQLEGIVEWGPLQQTPQDQTLRFVHPVLASEFLRQKGIREEKQRVGLLRPLLESLSSGHPADVWLSEAIATEVLAPKFQERFYGGWEWRIQAFQFFPPQLSSQSKTILHHWARCLYLSVDEKNGTAWTMPTTTRRERLQESISLLRKALAIPQRIGRDEHPSHLYNTLATAYSRLAVLLEMLANEPETAEQAWQQCCKYFEESIRLSGRTNVEALLAFAKRRVEHAYRHPDGQNKPTKESIDELVEALSLLDEAQDIVENLPSPEIKWEDEIRSYRVTILNGLDSASAAEFVDTLKASPKPDLGYYCHAQLMARDKNDPHGRDAALKLLLDARAARVALGHRSLHLLVSLMRSHSAQQYNYALMRQIYLDLEKVPGYTSRPFDQFWHAVVCYQTGQYQEGAQRFAKLRDQSRHLDNFRLRVRAVLCDRQHRNRPWELVARVTRIVSDFRAEGFVEEIGQKVLLRPRHWAVMPKVNEPVRCVIRFEANGPLAVPARFEAAALRTSAE